MKIYFAFGKFFCGIAVVLIVAGCKSFFPVEKNPLNGVESRELERKGHSESQEEVFYGKRSEIKIVRKVEIDKSGSLFRPESATNWLFVEKSPLSIGSIVRATVPRLGEPLENDEPDPIVAQEDELLEDLPEFEESEEAGNGISTVALEVIGFYSNGDPRVLYARESTSGVESKKIRLEGRLPVMNYAADSKVSLASLVDLTLIEKSDADDLRKTSTGWNPEFTKSIRGFDEARDQERVELDQKRQQLMDVKDRLQKRINSVGKERLKISEEREKMAEKDEVRTEKVDEIQAELEEKKEVIEEKEETIEQQEDTIKRLKAAEEKAADEQEGAD